MMSKITRDQIQGIVMGRMSRRVEDEPAGMQPLKLREYCTHPEHGPPSMLYVPPGNKYVHYCPACNAKSVLHNHTPTLQCEAAAGEATHWNPKDSNHPDPDRVLRNLQVEMEFKGVMDIKVHFNPTKVHSLPASEVKADLAEILRMYLDGKAKQVDGIGDTSANTQAS